MHRNGGNFDGKTRRGEFALLFRLAEFSVGAISIVFVVVVIASLFGSATSLIAQRLINLKIVGRGITKSYLVKDGLNEAIGLFEAMVVGGSGDRGRRGGVDWTVAAYFQRRHGTIVRCCECIW